MEFYPNRGRRTLTDSPQRPALNVELVQALREGLAKSSSRRGLSPEARNAIRALCASARKDGWTAERLVVAIKEACYTSPELTDLTPASERDALLATVVTGCIQEFFKSS